jgi:hypothetical protein
MDYLARIPLALFDRLGAGNESLRGDLLEELKKGRSPWWLWRQVIGEALRHPPSMARVSVFAVVSALLILLSFEAVVVTNLVIRMVFGPPFPDITAYLYLHPSETPAIPGMPISTMWTVVAASVVGGSLPIGRLIARLHARHHLLALAAFGCTTMMCATITMPAGVLTQFLTIVGVILGLLVGSGFRDADSGLGGKSAERDARCIRA